MKNMQDSLDFIGVGIGPSHLSLASLTPSSRHKSFLFLDDKSHFQWHPELMFKNAQMQTSYLKDLVSSADPTSQFSFLNYLHRKGLFFQFLNMNRSRVTRIEFEDYCRWVANELGDLLQFNQRVQNIEFDGELFKVQTNRGIYRSRHLSVGSGPSPQIPPCCQPFLGRRMFHVKDNKLSERDLTDKRVVVIGGGQSGLEFFRNALKGKWGRAHSLKLISARDGLRPLEQGAFTDETYSPGFTDEFFNLAAPRKAEFNQRQVLTSDGNTPEDLEAFYEELYLDRHYHRSFAHFEILPCRYLSDVKTTDEGFTLQVENLLDEQLSFLKADLVVLATGFTQKVPAYMDTLHSYLLLDKEGRFSFNPDYSLKTKLKSNKIYALNFSRHAHGIADPQTSLMAWKSAKIINSLCAEEIYQLKDHVENFSQHFSKGKKGEEITEAPFRNPALHFPFQSSSCKEEGCWKS